jgi:YVTN family beta-propeller protein
MLSRYMRLNGLALICVVIIIASVSVSNQASAYIPHTIKVDSSPWDITVNSATNTIYISHVDSISVIDGSNYNVVATVPLNPNDYVEGIEVNPLTNRLYATARDSNVVYVIDTLTNKVIEKIPARGEPEGIAVNPVTNLIYVANSASGRSESYDVPLQDDLVSVINGSTNQIVADIDVGGKFLSEEGILKKHKVLVLASR